MLCKNIPIVFLVLRSITRPKWLINTEIDCVRFHQINRNNNKIGIFTSNNHKIIAHQIVLISSEQALGLTDEC